MDKKLMATIALVTLVVSVVLSIGAATITGNYIWVTKQQTGTNRIYTVNEIDLIVKNLNSRISAIESGSCKSSETILKVSTVSKSSLGYQNDLVRFSDARNSSVSHVAVITSEGVGYIVVNGATHTVKYYDDRSKPDDEYVELISTSGSVQKAYEGSYIVIF